VRTFGAASRAGRAARFAAAVAPELARRPAALLAHMVPLYAILAAPLARPLRVPVLLWYTQWHASRAVRLAVSASSVVLTADERSFPVASPKVRAIGHGVDTGAFACAPPRPADGELRALALGRYARVKGYGELVQAVNELDEVSLTIAGPTLAEADRAVRKELEALAGPRVVLRDGVAWRAVPSLLAEHDVLLSNTVAGSADKVVYEAAAACRPPFASSPAFAALLPEELRFSSAEELAARLRAYAALPSERRDELARSLRERVVDGHSAERWAERVLDAVDGCRLARHSLD
jgi:glycosyltransferase involved in cell wall biosynthesis